MTRPVLREYAAVQREQYLAATHAETGPPLDEVVAVIGPYRKAAIRVLRRVPRADCAIASRAGYSENVVRLQDGFGYGLREGMVPSQPASPTAPRQLR